MDLRWPILGVTVLAAVGADASLWTLKDAIGPTADAGVSVAARALNGASS